MEEEKSTSFNKDSPDSITVSLRVLLLIHSSVAYRFPPLTSREIFSSYA